MGAVSESHQPRIALVTGGNRGIGLEVCRRLATLGCRVLLSGRNQRGVDEAVDRLRRDGARVEPRILDVTDERGILSFADRVIADLGGVDIVVNNAAVLLGEQAMC